MRLGKMYFSLCVLILLDILGCVLSHGRLRSPPSRSTMWRYGFPAPHNYNDHELNCGGFTYSLTCSALFRKQNHWGRNQGKCGVCGDNFRDSRPRDNEGGGKYGRGVIVREYAQGEIIQAEVEVTANHKGYFEFSVCPHNSPLTPANEECFVPLELAEGSGTRWQLHDDVSPKTYTIGLKLPVDITCNQCVFRWYWKSGNNWGVENGQSGLGYGPQETFIACSDIRIHAGEIRPVSGSASARGRRPLIGRPRTTTTTTTPRPTPAIRGRDQRPSVDTDETWQPEPDVGHDHAHTDTEVRSCRAVGVWSMVTGMDAWCETNCALNFCPISHCCCNC